MRFSAAVIGLGNIGMGYDYDEPDRVLTHCRAFAAHPGFELAAAADPDAAARQRFMRQYGRPCFASPGELMQHLRPEVFAIGVPTPLHADTLQQLLDARPRAALCEKPLAHNLPAARGMVETAAAAGCALAVNYMRRFDPGVSQLKAAIADGELGEVYKGTAWYSKGLRHNGTHMIDLLRFLLGEVEAVSLVDRGRLWAGIDPEPDFRLQFGAAQITVLAAREECFSHFQLELLASRGRVLYADGGESIQVSILEGTGSARLAPQAGRFRADLGRYQWHVARALHAHLDHGEALPSDGVSALATQETVEKILSQCETAA
ncbi:MAG TPA: Gfo/Idh/MocA family oxidoreductase [Burkholderiales bacterium]|nr:Gfo/Idh/MocA family oxidoreductase [Burkholderiales bacterium]